MTVVDTMCHRRKAQRTLLTGRLPMQQERAVWAAHFPYSVLALLPLGHPAQPRWQQGMAQMAGSPLLAWKAQGDYQVPAVLAIPHETSQ